MEQPKEYYAFISYKREDKREARRLQHALEYYRLPNHLRQENPELPEYVRPVFRDMTDLEVGELSAQIHAGLEQSHFLIVVCSPRAAASKWVNDEVEYFISLGKQNKIIPYIIEGVPHASNPDEECYPPSLLNLSKEKELLGANINEVGKDSATIRVVSRMFNIRFDTLFQRYQREQKKRRRQLIVAIVLAFLFLSGIAGWIWRQNVLLKEREWKMMENQARAVAEKANQLVDDGDSYLARMLLLETLKPERPYVPDLESCLRKAYSNNTAVLHSDAENWAICFSPDDKYIVSGDGLGRIKVWDAYSGVLVHNLKEHDAMVLSISFSPDGKHFASTSNDKTIKIWDIENGKLIRTLKGHGHYVYSALYDKDGKKIISASADSTIRIWNASTGDLLKSFKEKESFVRYAQFSPDGKSIIEQSTDSLIRIRDIRTGVLKNMIQGHKMSLESLEYSPSGDKIISTSYDGAIKIWNAKTYIEEKCFTPSQSVSGATFTPDEKYIIAYSWIGDTIRVLDASNGHIEKIFVKHIGGVHDVSVSSDSKRLVSASSDNTLRIWDLNNNRHIKLIGEGTFFDVQYTKDGNFIIARTLNENVSRIGLWDSRTGDYVKDVMDAEDANGQMALSPDNKLLALSVGIGLFGGETPILLFNTNKGTTIRIEAHDINSIAFSSDHKKLLVSSDNGFIQIWDIESANLIKTINVAEIYTNMINSVCYSQNNDIIIISSRDNTIGLLDAHNHKLTKVLKGHVGPVHECLSNKNGSLLYSASSDNTVKIWDIKSGLCVKTLLHTNGVNTISLSSDDKWLASGADDRMIRVWNAKTGELVCSLNGHKDRVSKVEFSPDNHHILSYSLLDNNVTIWSFPLLQELIDETYERFKNRQLTPEERRKYYLE